MNVSLSHLEVNKWDINGYLLCPNTEPTTKPSQVPMGSYFSYSVQSTAGTINILSSGTACPFSVWKHKQIKRRIKDVANNDKTVGILFLLTLTLSRTINLIDDSWWPSCRSLYWSKHEPLLTSFSCSHRLYSGSLCCQLSPWSHIAFFHICCHFCSSMEKFHTLLCAIVRDSSADVTDFLFCGRGWAECLSPSAWNHRGF